MSNWISKSETIAKSKKYYAHFDCRTNMGKVSELVTNAEWVSHHGFFPFIHYEIKISKYNGKEVKHKSRDICYAAHLDRCILQYYCHLLNERYNKRIRELQIEKVAVAYRSDLGKNNIHFAKQAIDFMKSNPKAYVLIGDFTGFFDYLDHQYLKRQWCNLLEADNLPPDHYTIFKNITRYSVWELDDLLRLNGLPLTRKGIRDLNSRPIVLDRKKYKQNRSNIKKHIEPYGIPQGSPISALLANVYMMEVDKKIKEIVNQCSGLYMRYSDDFIIVLPVKEEEAKIVIDSINEVLKSTPGLTLEPQKTQIYKIDLPQINNVGNLFLENADCSKTIINFLGFTFNGVTTTLRAKTVSKYYYRMLRKAHKIATDPEKKGKRQLYERYSEKGARVDGKQKGNFFTYVHRAERIFGDTEEIRRPVKRHMKKIKMALRRNSKNSRGSESIQN